MGTDENVDLLVPNIKKNFNWKSEVREWIEALVVATAVAFLFTNFVCTQVTVLGSSMEPTLHTSERLFVRKLFYKPHRGDIVIFNPHTDTKPYVKRVIAVAGDSIYIDFYNGDILVNGELIEERYIKEKTSSVGDYIRTLILKGEYGRDKPIVVGEGMIFVMGDNRNNSTDSRRLGLVPVHEIVGKAVFRVWPFDKFGSLYG